MFKLILSNFGLGNFANFENSSTIFSIDETLAPGVRTAITYEDDTKTKVIGTRTEMEVQQLGWFEAEKTTDGTYKLTTKGKSDKSTAESMAAGGDDSGGGGGTCN